jgi:hypothetical protein
MFVINVRFVIPMSLSNHFFLEPLLTLFGKLLDILLIFPIQPMLQICLEVHQVGFRGLLNNKFEWVFVL